MFGVLGPHVGGHASCNSFEIKSCTWRIRTLLILRVPTCLRPSQTFCKRLGRCLRRLLDHKRLLFDRKSWVYACDLL